MRALVFNLSLPKYLVAKAANQIARGPVSRLHYGPGSCFDLRDVPAPELPASDWLGLAPRACGLCGSDLGAIFFKMSPAMSAISMGAGEPSVFGHETLAVVHAVGSEAKGRAKEGDRVVIDPVLGCDVRGVRPCARCLQGEYGTCERFGDAHPRGLMIGANPRFPGGFGDRMVAHRSQIFRVPDSLSDDVAVLTEPLTVAVRAVLRSPPRDGDHVLVIGGGAIAFACLWAIKEIVPGCHVTLLTTEAHQIDLADRFGADDVLLVGKNVVEDAARKLGTKLLKPILGRTYLAGGYEQIFDCVGSTGSLDDALHMARAGGRIVLVGAAGVTGPLDWTFVWSRDLTITGTVFYGHDSWKGGRARTFEIALELMTTTKANLGELVTHKFPLEAYGQAIEVSVDRRRHKSLKAVLTL